MTLEIYEQAKKLSLEIGSLQLFIEKIDSEKDNISGLVYKGTVYDEYRQYNINFPEGVQSQILDSIKDAINQRISDLQLEFERL